MNTPRDRPRDNLGVDAGDMQQRFWAAVNSALPKQNRCLATSASAASRGASKLQKIVPRMCIMLDDAVAAAGPSCMGTITFLRRHQSNRTHGPARGPVDRHSGHETLDDAVGASIIDDALHALSITCTMAMLSAASRTSAPAALEAIRASFAAACRLRHLLASAGDDLLTSGAPRIRAIYASLNESFDTLETATKSLQRHHGLAHMADIIEQGNADQASRKLFAKAVASNPLIIRDEATAAGVQALREMVGPLNEIQIGLATVRSAAMGRNIDNEPF